MHPLCHSLLVFAHTPLRLTKSPDAFHFSQALYNADLGGTGVTVTSTRCKNLTVLLQNSISSNVLKLVLAKKCYLSPYFRETSHRIENKCYFLHADILPVCRKLVGSSGRLGFKNTSDYSTLPQSEKC